MIEVTIQVDGRAHAVKMTAQANGWTVNVDGTDVAVHVARTRHEAVVNAGGSIHSIQLADAGTALIDGRATPFALLELHGVDGAMAESAGTLGPIKPPMTGRIETVVVAPGDVVARGDVLFVLEAMKMRNEVKSPGDGVVKAVHVADGAAVDPNTIILELVAAD
jgi:biotin carboxyl carrier protein